MRRRTAAAKAADGQRPDGRSLRREQNRRAIAEALLAFYRAGVPHPTAWQIAERAGVSLRSVFGHFERLDELHTEAALLHLRTVLPPLRAGPVFPTGPLAERLEAFTSPLFRFFEENLAVERVARILQQESPVLRGLQERADQLRRARLQVVFGEELRAGPTSEHAGRLETILLLTSFESWDRLRGLQGLSANLARRTLVQAIRVLLERAR